MSTLSRPAAARLGTLALIWGCSFLFIKVGLEGLSPVQVVLGRMTGGAVVLLACLAWQRQAIPRDRRLWAHLAWVSIVANVVPFALLAWGEERVASSRAGVLNATTPLATALIAVAALPEERLSKARLAGLLVGFGGVVVVVGPWHADGANSLPGQLACIAAAFSYGVAITWTRKFISPSGQPPLVLAAGQIGCGAVLLWLASPVVAADATHITPKVALCVGLLGVFGTGIAYVLFYGLIAEVGATSASLVTYLAPVVAVTMGVIVLGEDLGWNLFAGAAVVILGVAITENRVPWLRAGPPPDEPADGRVLAVGDLVETVELQPE